jgi:hypothetical protein
MRREPRAAGARLLEIDQVAKTASITTGVKTTAFPQKSHLRRYV